MIRFALLCFFTDGLTCEGELPLKQQIHYSIYSGARRKATFVSRARLATAAFRNDRQWVLGARC